MRLLLKNIHIALHHHIFFYMVSYIISFFLFIFRKKSLRSTSDSLSRNFLVKIKRKFLDGKLKINISHSLNPPLTHGCRHFSFLTKNLTIQLCTEKVITKKNICLSFFAHVLLVLFKM